MRTRRLLATCAAIGTSLALVLGVAPTASAATPPDWPSAGRIPVGCDPTITVGGSAAAPTYTYTDSAYPTIVSVGYDAGRRIVVPPSGVSTRFSVRMRQTCSGVQGLGIYVRIAGSSSVFEASGLTPLTTDAFTSTWSSPVGNITAGVGLKVQFPIAEVARRYTTFTLDKDYRLISKVDAGDSRWVQDTWSDDWTYILVATRISATVSSSKVAKGRTITVKGVVQTAKPGTWQAYHGGRVTLQTKVGSGAWTSRATLIASAAGAVTSSLKIKKKTRVRFVVGDVLTPPFTAASTSPVRTVKIA